MGLRNIFLIIVLMFGCLQAWDQEHYTAAVYEHNRQGKNITDDPAAVTKSNLEYYKRATRVAKEQGADIILFPEYGIFSPQNRSELKKYLEFVPDPKERNVTPCDETELFADRQIMYALSCMAKINKIVVVANMGSIEKCGNETGCPEDGDLHLNANVAFDEKGTLIARYFKERLFFELGMDLPREKQDPFFKTKFGKFAMFICFDIIFEKMTVTSQLQEIDAILFSSMWMNWSPFYISTQWFQSWAIGNNATIIASNMQMPGYLSAGIGIFKGKTDSVAHTLNPDGISKLVVAKIPRGKGNQGISSANITAILKNGIHKFKDEGKDIPEVCSYDILGPAKDINKDYRCSNENLQNYTLVKLQKAKDYLVVCNNNMCCQLDYEANNMKESYYFGVYNGSHVTFHRYFWWDENCFLARCDDVNGTACSNFPMISDETLFHRISMTANFTTKHIYPSFVSSRIRLVPIENWDFIKRPDSSTITMNNDSGIAVIAATLKGRVYERDPPYIR